MRHSFKVRFVFFYTCGSHELCHGPTKKNAAALKCAKHAI